MSYYRYPYTQPPSNTSIVYVPQMSSQKVSRSVSIIAIILIIALLFVGMKLFSDDGFYQSVNLDWNRGYIDEDTGKAVNESWGKSYGMYTVDHIKIGKGVRIDLKFDSKITYQVLAYDENDKYLGAMGDPCACGQELKQDDFTGEFATAKYIRIFAYEKTDDLSGITPSEKEFTFFDMLSVSNHIKVYTIPASNVEDNIEDIT